MIENKGVRRSVRSIAIAHHHTGPVNGESFPVGSSQGAEVGGSPVEIRKGMESIVAGTVPANDLGGIVDGVSGLQGVWVVGVAKTEVLHRIFGKEHRAMILGAALAIADHSPAFVNPKCFAGRGTFEGTERGYRLISGKEEGQDISVGILAVAGDFPAVV